MRLKQINALIISALMLWQFAGIGLLSADLDCSGRVDLRDAIMAVQGLHAVADVQNTVPSGTHSLAAEFRKALRVFESAAERTPALEARDAKEKGTAQAFIALTSIWHFNAAGMVSGFFPNLSNTFHSTFPEYPTPPPRMAT